MNLTHRMLFVAWQNPTTRRILPVGRLLEGEQAPVWEFVYIEGARTAASLGFSPFPGLPVFDRVYRSDELFPLFGNRIMPKSRPDYPAFLARLGLAADKDEEIPILVRSEGRRATDTIEVFGLPTYDSHNELYRFLFFLRGIRYVKGAEECIAELAHGTGLVLEHEHKNPIDPLAVLVKEGAKKQIGYVPATLNEEIHQLRRFGSRIEVSVERVNPAPAPVQERLLCRLSAQARRGYLPFAGERYRPIPVEATPVDVIPEALVEA